MEGSGADKAPCNSNRELKKYHVSLGERDHYKQVNTENQSGDRAQDPTPWARR